MCEGLGLGYEMNELKTSELRVEGGGGPVRDHLPGPVLSFSDLLVIDTTVVSV